MKTKHLFYILLASSIIYGSILSISMMDREQVSQSINVTYVAGLRG